jgi:hypothetical protein
MFHNYRGRNLTQRAKKMESGNNRIRRLRTYRTSMQKLNTPNKEGGSTLRNGITSGITVFVKRKLLARR